MEYYKAYEKRYQAVYNADIELWGNSEKDIILAETIKKWVPLLPARARSKERYVTELTAAGFFVEAFEHSKENGAILRSADIYVRKA